MREMKDAILEVGVHKMLNTTDAQIDKLMPTMGEDFCRLMCNLAGVPHNELRGKPLVRVAIRAWKRLKGQLLQDIRSGKVVVRPMSQIRADLETARDKLQQGR